VHRVSTLDKIVNTCEITYITILTPFTMSSIFKATHITSDRMLAQPSAYGFGAIPITTGLNAFRDPSGFGHAWNLPQASSSPTSPRLYATAARNFTT
jgi:hypothetical protein